MSEGCRHQAVQGKDRTSSKQVSPDRFSKLPEEYFFRSDHCKIFSGESLTMKIAVICGCLFSIAFALPIPEVAHTVVGKLKMEQAPLSSDVSKDATKLKAAEKDLPFQSPAFSITKPDPLLTDVSNDASELKAAEKDLPFQSPTKPDPLVTDVSNDASELKTAEKDLPFQSPAFSITKPDPLVTDVSNDASELKASEKDLPFQSPAISITKPDPLATDMNNDASELKALLSSDTRNDATELKVPEKDLAFQSLMTNPDFIYSDASNDIKGRKSFPWRITEDDYDQEDFYSDESDDYIRGEDLIYLDESDDYNTAEDFYPSYRSNNEEAISLPLETSNDITEEEALLSRDVPLAIKSWYTADMEPELPRGADMQ
ncbi:polynucleotide 5'-hydroxyl-kinase NOL9-like isoform X9 [Hemicordylus capensis]|uniref:polynucleotide 5'-hydroxyl-kinase NOL9-like isoform X9 n=1 Tax=Hemicordylus capensis TaxID=884348 RepID=UPI002303B9C9|nr:polynucleotide 5'-hydroxyl-kinase NOL9-like isoform X9 [Hemicordylus capensis]